MDTHATAHATATDSFAEGADIDDGLPVNNHGDVTAVHADATAANDGFHVSAAPEGVISNVMRDNDGNELDDVLGAHAEATMAATRDALAAGYLDGRVLGAPDVNKLNVGARQPTRGFVKLRGMSRSV